MEDAQKINLDEAYSILDSGNYPQALAAFESITKSNPSCDEAMLMIGSISGETGDIDKALKYVQKAIDINPNNVGAYLVLGQIKNSIGEVDAAIVAFDKALQISPEDMDALRARAYLYQVQGEIGEAIKLFEKIIILDKTAYDIWSVLAALYFHNNNAEKARQCYEESFAAGNDTPEAFLDYCAVLNHFGESSEVIRRLSNVPEAVTKMPELYVQLSLAYANEGDNDRSLQFIDKAIEISSTQKYVLAKADLLQLTGRYEEAFELLKPFLEQELPPVPAVFTLVKFCKHIGLDEECIKLLKRLNESNTVTPFDKANIADALESLQA